MLTYYHSQGEQALARRQRLVKALLSSRQLPAAGWDEGSIEMLVRVGSFFCSSDLPSRGVGLRISGGAG